MAGGLRNGQASAHGQCHARILLLADTQGPRRRLERCANRQGRADEHPHRRADAAGLCRARAGAQDPDRHYERKLDGKAEAQLLALCCGEAPPGRARWTLRLLVARLVELEIVAE